MKKLERYANKYALATIENDDKEIRSSYLLSNGEGRIIFPNGWYAHIAINTFRPEKNAKYSVALSDYNGWFNWDKLNKYGADDGRFYCNTEDEIIRACEIIRKLKEGW